MKQDNLTKKYLIKYLNYKLGYSLNFSKKLINDLIKILIENIKDGRLNLKNIGSFRLIYKKDRVGRNPKTMENFVISSRRSVSFTPSKKILQHLDSIHE